MCRLRLNRHKIRVCSYTNTIVASISFVRLAFARKDKRGKQKSAPAYLLAKSCWHPTRAREHVAIKNKLVSLHCHSSFNKLWFPFHQLDRHKARSYEVPRYVLVYSAKVDSWPVRVNYQIPACHIVTERARLVHAPNPVRLILAIGGRNRVGFWVDAVNARQR